MFFLVRWSLLIAASRSADLDRWDKSGEPLETCTILKGCPGSCGRFNLTK
jgi:hypothetical protein